MERLGDYTIERELARGGMGVVYLAQDSIGRRVALKVLLERTDPVERARFRREAEAIGRIQHPGVVEVHSFEQDPRGRDYLVMSLIEGESLADRLRRDGPLSPRAAAELVRAIADALVVTHARGVLHRDIKPSNVLLRAEDGAPVLTDFGLARVSDQTQRLTETGTMHGTPAYMPPEQAQGELDRIGPPSDVYGLGALLFQALTGRAPFVGSNPMAILMALLSTPAPSASSLAPDVPAALDAIVARCLEKVPASRYPSAEALRDALDDYLMGSAAPPPRSPAITVFLVVVVAALLVGLGLRLRSDASPLPRTSQTSGLPSPEPRATTVAPEPASRTLRLTHPDFKALPAQAIGVRFLPGNHLLTWAKHSHSAGDHSSVRWSGPKGMGPAQWVFPGELVNQATRVNRGVVLLLHARRLVWLAGPDEDPVELFAASSSEQFTAVAFWPKGELLAVAVNPLQVGQNHIGPAPRIDLYAWNGTTRVKKRSFLGHQDPIQTLAFNATGHLVSCSGGSKASASGQVMVHAEGGQVVVQKKTISLIRAAAIDSVHVAFGDNMRRIEIASTRWSRSKFSLLIADHSPQKEGAAIFQSGVSASGSLHALALRGDRLFARTWSGDQAEKAELVIWDLRSGKSTGGLTQFRNLQSFDVSLDGSRIALGLVRAESGFNLEVWPVERLSAKLLPRAEWIRAR